MVFELWGWKLGMLHWHWSRQIALYDGLELHSFEPLHSHECRRENDPIVRMDTRQGLLCPVPHISEGIADSCKDCRHPGKVDEHKTVAGLISFQTIKDLFLNYFI